MFKQLLAVSLGVMVLSSAQGALYVGKITNASTSKPLVLQSVSVKNADLMPPKQLPAGKSGFFSINDQRAFLTMVYGYDGANQEPTKSEGPASTCVLIMTAKGEYRISATNPETVECTIVSEDEGGVSVSMKDK